MTQIPDNLWETIFSFGSISDLGVMACCSKRFNNITNSNFIWKNNCKRLWATKQNHPCERWVRYQRFEHICDLSAYIHESWGLSTYIYDDNDCIGNKLAFEEKNIESLLSNYHSLYESVTNLQSQIDAGNNDAGLHFILLESLNRLRNVQYVLHFRFAQIKRDKIHKAETRKVLNCQTRLFAPLSHAIRDVHIRTEALLMDHASELDPDILQSNMLKLFTASIDLERCEYEANRSGSLLTWKQSYHASLQDSFRRYITYEELRAQGDWLITFSTEVEMCRFVDGGRKFIDNRAFRNKCCTIKLHEDRLLFSHIGQHATAYRTQDWGWELVCDNGFVTVESFDKRKGPSAMPLKTAYRSDDHNINEEEEVEVASPSPLESPLIENPLNALFSLL